MRKVLLRLLLGLAVFVPLGWLGLHHHYPPLPGALPLALTLPAGEAGQTVPLVTTGNTGAGDLLYVRYATPTTVVFGYDSWAVGGPVSAPLAITPGAAQPLLVEMPSLAAPPRVDRHAQGPLRVRYADTLVLAASVHYYGRLPAEVYLADNPLGGTVTNTRFRGVLATAAGEPLAGRPDGLFPWAFRLRHWLISGTLSAGATLAVALAVALWGPAGWRWGRLRVWCPRPAPAWPGGALPTHGVFLLTSLVCTGLFAAVITGGTFRLLFPESFGQFYDYQAASLLAGRLDVPEAALGAESFVVAGKYYGYFGPTPALLRLPLVLAGLGFGQLSRAFMVGYYWACLAAVYALLLHASRLLSGGPSWPPRASVVVLVGVAGLGSTLFFAGSRAYIYHEAILCGAACSLWGAWAVLRWIAAPGENRWWQLALAGGVAAVHARPPMGLFTLAFLGCAAAVHAWPRRCAERPGPGPRAPRLRPLLVGGLAVVGVLSFNGLSYLKFKSFEGAPLRYHVQYHPERVAVIDGRNFHPGNLPYGFSNYIWRPNFTFRPTFPYFFIHGTDPLDFPGARIDLAEDTLALPYAMPALVFLAALAPILALTHWPAARQRLLLLLLAATPMAAALFAAVAVSHRYTADFAPVLIAAAAFGLAAIPVLPAPARRTLFAIAIILSAASLFITLALTLHYQGEVVWGVPDDIKARYLALRQSMDHLLGFPPP